MRKKRRFLAGVLAGCMLMGQTVFAEEAVTDDQSYFESDLEETTVSEEQEETTVQSNLEADTENEQKNAQEEKRESGDPKETEQTKSGNPEETEVLEDSMEVQSEIRILESSDQKESREIVSQQQNEIEEVSLGENNEPVTISTEIDEAGATVRYCFCPEESGGYYIDLMDQGQFSVYEETSYGDYKYIGSDTSTDNKYGSVVFDATAGATYYVDINYSSSESIGTIRWKLGRPQQIQTGSYEAVISEPGGKAHYELLCEEVDMVYFSMDHRSSGYVYYDLWDETGHLSFLSSGHYEKRRIQNGKCFVSIYYYDLTSTGTVEWQADSVYTQNISENELVHTTVSSDDEHLVYMFVPQEDGRYRTTYYNANVYDEFMNSVENNKVDLKAGETYYIMLYASAGDDFYWSIKRSNEIVIEEGETIHTEANNVDYYRFIPEESGKYSISSSSVDIYDSDWNRIWESKVDLLEGQTYYMIVSGGGYAVDWSVNKMEETVITAGQSYLVAPEKSEYFKFVPNESGEYTITTSGWMKVYDSEWNEMWDYELTAGETYYLMSDSTDETFYFAINQSEEKEATVSERIEIQAGEEYVTTDEKAHVIGMDEADRYILVPEETGRYYFCPKERAYFVIIHEGDRSSLYYPDYGINLEAGEEYEIIVRIPSAIWNEVTDIHWRIEKASVSTVIEQTEYVTREGSAREYEFIPKTSGYYMVDANGEGSCVIYDSDWNPIDTELGEAGIYYYTDKGEFGSIILMEAGQTYYINILPDSGETSWQINHTQQTDEYLYRTMADGTVQIIEYLGNFSSIEIPEYIDGKKVTSIGPRAFYGYENLQSIIIPDGVRSIKTEAFYECTGLERVEFGSGLEEIGKRAFANVSKITAINLPDSLTTLGENAFESCISLNSISLSEKLTGIEAGAFMDCENLEVIELPKNTTYIGDLAFYRTNLQQINIPDSVTNIGDSAFERCSLLKEVNIGSGVKRIEGYAFAFCDLTQLTISGNVQFIGEAAFIGNSNLREVELPDSVESVVRFAFDNTAWYESQENGAVYTGKVLYKYKDKMPKVTTVTVANGTKVIAEAAFEYQYRLEEIILPETLINIGDYAFYGCELLTEVYIPQNVKKIGEYSLGYLDVDLGENIEMLKVPDFTIYGVKGSAAQTYAEENGFVFVEVEPEYTPGDIDENGRVDIADLRMVLRAVCSKTELSSQQQLAADVETDGIVNIADLRKILRFVCGKLEEL